MADAIINGKCYDWSDITIDIPGAEDAQVTEISYDFEHEAEAIYGSGGTPRGYGTGNKKYTIKLSMLREDYNQILRYCKKRGKKLSVLNIPQITVSYANDDQGTSTDVLRGIILNKHSFSGKQGDKSLTVSLDGFMYKAPKLNGVTF